MECHQVGHSTRWKELNKVLECSACHNQCCNQKENDKGRNHEFPPVPDRIILVLTRPHSTIIDIGLLFLLYVESQFHNQFQCLYGCLPVVFSF